MTSSPIAAKSSSYHDLFASFLRFISSLIVQNQVDFPLSVFNFFNILAALYSHSDPSHPFPPAYTLIPILSFTPNRQLFTFGNRTGEFESVRVQDPCVVATPTYSMNTLTVAFAVKPGCGDEGTRQIDSTVLFLS